jgi:hypothetical protein
VYLPDFVIVDRDAGPSASPRSDQDDPGTGETMLETRADMAWTWSSTIVECAVRRPRRDRRLRLRSEELGELLHNLLHTFRRRQLACESLSNFGAFGRGVMK